MLFFYSGTDRAKARDAMRTRSAALEGQGSVIVRITDANNPNDLGSALRSGGLFVQKRVVIFEGVLENEEMRVLLIPALPTLKSSTDHFFILEEKLDAATRKHVEKYAEKSERFDAPKKAEGAPTIFALANALRAGNKKALWVGYQRELLNDAAPEAIHGVLFWAAKDMVLTSRSESETIRAKRFVEQLTELPHDARRRGEDLEYALERFVLSVART